jgi:hypothetical protein
LLALKKNIIETKLHLNLKIKFQQMKKIFFIFTLIITCQLTNAQANRVITTGVPFLLIAGDARSAGMGDMGVASSTDAYSQQSNPAKFAFSNAKTGISVSYTPYLPSIASDISLGQITYFNRFNDQSSFAGSFRYFGLGDIQLADEVGNSTGVVSPNELAIDGSYALKLSESFAMSVAGRYVRSSLRIPNSTNDASAASTFAFDVSGFYQSEEIAYESFNGKWRAGFNLQNLGPKISYDQNVERASNFLPSNLKLGAGFDFILDEYNKVNLITEVTKLLVPTPQNATDANGDGFINGVESQANADIYNSIGWSDGIFKSFNDAPDGFSEELKEFTWALGAEYWYQDSFALRTGYFNESEQKGARKFFTLGAGFKYNTMMLDVSYLFSASKVRNPLENTLRFSLTFNFGDSYDDN